MWYIRVKKQNYKHLTVQRYIFIPTLPYETVQYTYVHGVKHLKIHMHGLGDTECDWKGYIKLLLRIVELSILKRAGMQNQIM